MRSSLAAAACLLLFGCALPPTSADVGFGGSSTPSAVPAPAGPGSARDGIYVGTADLVVNGFLGGCRSPMSITAFRVDGNTLRFGGFRATITADGTVPMTTFRGMWFAGRFEGQTFVGNVDGGEDYGRMFDGCTYAISVVRQTT